VSSEETGGQRPDRTAPKRDFSGAAQPLTLSAGMHRIELQAPGYDPLVFDVNVVPGLVTPYQGGMQPRY